MTINLAELEEAAGVLSTIDHLAAHLHVTVDELKPHLDLIKQARLRSEHQFLSMLQKLAIAEDKSAMSLWASFIQMDAIPRKVDATIKLTKKEMLDTLKKSTE